MVLADMNTTELVVEMILEENSGPYQDLNPYIRFLLSENQGAVYNVLCIDC